jgi:dipeptide/tripeptide permease
VLSDCVEVLGNARFFLCAAGVLVALLAAGQEWLTWRTAALFLGGWVALNLLADAALLTVGRDWGARLPRMRLGNWRFALYLLILSGFWTSFIQIFTTMNLYIRDFVQTRPLLELCASVCRFIGADGWAGRLTSYAEAGGQVNPEYIVNIDAGSIVCFQILISLIVHRMGRFPGMIFGILIAAVGIGLALVNGRGEAGTLEASVAVVVLGILIFSIGEMMASPTSQEFIGNIAPKDTVALYMGYYFVAMALGNLFGGVLGGHLYGALARDRGRPDLMWAIFGGLGILTAGALALYNRFAIQRTVPDPAAGPARRQ